MKLWHFENDSARYHVDNYITFAETSEEAYAKIVASIKEDTPASDAVKELEKFTIREVFSGVLSLGQYD